MMTYTTFARLPVPAAGDRNWDGPLIVALGLLDAAPGVGAFCVRPAESPSASLGLLIAGGTFRNSVGLPVPFVARAATAPANATTRYWVDDGGYLGTGPDWPAYPCLRLATVQAFAASVVVADERVAFGSTFATAPPAYLPLTGGSVVGRFITRAQSGFAAIDADPENAAIGFLGKAPATKATGLPPLTDSTTGAVGGTLVDVGATPSQAAINNNFASLAAQVASLNVALRRFGLTT